MGRVPENRMADIEGWSDRLQEIIDEMTGGNVTSFARLCQEKYPDLAPRREMLRDYLSQGSLPGADKLFVIAMVSGRNPTWLIAGQGPKHLPDFFSSSLPSSPEAADVLDIPYYRAANRHLEPVPDSTPFVVMKAALQTNSSEDLLIALQTTPDLSNDDLGIPMGSVAVSVLYDPEGLPVLDAFRHPEGLPTGVYLAAVEDTLRFLRLTAPSVRTPTNQYDIRSYEPGDEPEHSAPFAWTGPLTALDDARIYARVLTVWNHLTP